MPISGSTTSFKTFITSSFVGIFIVIYFYYYKLLLFYLTYFYNVFDNYCIVFIAISNLMPYLKIVKLIACFLNMHIYLINSFCPSIFFAELYQLFNLLLRPLSNYLNRAVCHISCVAL